MFGAICGDIIGSPYEFGQMKNYNFRLFVPDAHPTDDGILTCAVAQAILDLDNIYDFDELEEHCATRLIEFGRNHLNVGYGGNFRKWLLGEITGRQKSWGNGSGMRVSAVAWAYDNLDYVEVAARASAIPTHGSPEGIRGAKAIAAATYLARSGYDKEEIKDYIERKFYYDLDRTIDEIRPTCSFDVSCMGSVPVAIRAFLDGHDWESCVRNAVSVGGDADTIGAMTGAIAEAYYDGVPEAIRDRCLDMLPNDMKRTLRGWKDAGYAMGTELDL